DALAGELGGELLEDPALAELDAEAREGDDRSDRGRRFHVSSPYARQESMFRAGARSRGEDGWCAERTLPQVAAGAFCGTLRGGLSRRRSPRRAPCGRGRRPSRATS